MSLNQVCIVAILNNASLDTLASLPRVNKFFFHLVVCIIYKDPVKTLRESGTVRAREGNAECRLNYLIAQWSGFVSSTDASKPTQYETPTLPTTVKYYSLVQVMRANTLKMPVSWMASGKMNKEYFRHHGRKLVSVEIAVYEIGSLMAVVNRLSSLRSLFLQFHQGQSGAVMKNYQAVTTFVETHHSLFPGLLTEVEYL